MRTDLISIPTMDYGRHFLCLPYSILFILLLVLSNTDTLQSQISCIAQVRVSLDSRGQAQLDPGLFVRGDVTGHTIAVENSQLPDLTIVDCSFVNREVSVIVTNADGSRCWSNLIVEDKRDFTISVRDTSLVCTSQLENDSLLDLVTVVDNCISAEDFTISFNTVLDSIFDSESDTIRRDLRIWSVTDPNGNSEVFTSFIYITRLDTSLISFPTDTVLHSMTDARSTDITGVPTVAGEPIPELCNLNIVTSIEGPFLLDCDKRLKYNRTWTIVDVQHWEIVAEEVQTIRFIDTTLERIIAPDLSIETGSDCAANLEISEFEVTNSGIGTVIDQYKSILANGSTVFPGDRLELIDGDTVILEYNAFNDCFDPLESVVDTIIVSIPSEISIVSCNGHAVALSLGDDLNRKLNIDRIFTGTIQSCGNYTLVGARTRDVCDPMDTAFSKNVTFCTADIGTTVSVLVTAFDESGQYSADTCEILVDIQDNRIPQVECSLSSDTLFFGAIDSIARIGNLNRYFDFISADNIIAVTGSGSGIVNSVGSSFNFIAPFNSLGLMVGQTVGLDSFNCSFIDQQGLGQYNLDLTVEGGNGTSVTCPVNLTLLDTVGVCQTSSNFISGTVLAYGLSGLDDVGVSIGKNDGVINWAITDLTGEFTFKMESDATDIEVERSDSWHLNLTSNDLFLLEEILIGVYEPNQLEEASADMNNDGVVNTFDFIMMKRLLLGEEPNLIFERSPWNIFAKELVCLELDKCSTGHFALDSFEDFNDIQFWATKEGDIDQDAADQGESRSIESLNYILSDKESVNQAAKQSLTILTSEIHELSSLQFELNIPDEIEIEIKETPGLIYKRHDDKLRLIYTRDSENSYDDILIELDGMFHGLINLNNLHSTGDFESLMFIDGGKNKMVLNRIETPISFELLELGAMIYPNPSYSPSRLRLGPAWPSGHINCQIYNEIGELKWSETIVKNSDNIEEILLPSELGAGIYSVIIASDSEHIVKKYVKL